MLRLDSPAKKKLANKRQLPGACHAGALWIEMAGSVSVYGCTNPIAHELRGERFGAATGDAPVHDAGAERKVWPKSMRHVPGRSGAHRYPDATAIDATTVLRNYGQTTASIRA